ncbi:MAG: hypothetical protein C0599_17095 [Salinivirgaceae bacterium]|nr:MAG: hypothetical protein C0599_17095 [Salinivirgaceae bacterium]
MKNLSSTDYKNTFLDKTNFNDLNGSYHNTQDTVYWNMNPNLFSILRWNNKLTTRLPFKNNKELYVADEIKLSFINHKNLNISVIKNDTLITSKTFKGKLKNGFFQFRTNISLLPFFPIFFQLQYEKVRIGKSNNSLIIDEQFYKGLIILTLPVQDHLEKWTAIYKDTSTELKKSKH